MLQLFAIPTQSGEPQTDGIHLLWSAPPACGYALEGFNIWRRNIFQSSRTCIALDEPTLDYLREYFRLQEQGLSVLFRNGHTTWGEWNGRLCEYFKVNSARVSLAAYEIALPGVRHSVSIQVRMAVEPFFLVVVGMLNGKVNHVAAATDRNYFLMPFPADQLILYASGKILSLELCFLAPYASEKDWDDALLIASGIQLPFHSVNPALASVEDEFNLAVSRAIHPETISFEHFEQVSQLANAMFDVAEPVFPSQVAVATTSQPFEGSPNYVHTNAMGLLQSLQVKYDLRRALGFAFLDQTAEIGRVYDYKITGRFKKKHLSERVLGFHTVPFGLDLGSFFSLAGIQFRHRGNGSLKIAAFPEIPSGVPFHCYKKGIRIENSISITFPQPVRSAVLFFEPGYGQYLIYEAASFAFRDVPHQENGSIPLDQSRVVLSFEHSIDRLTLNGRGFFTGLAYSSLGDPEEIVELSACHFNVRYQDTPLPPPPQLAKASNLQKDWSSGGDFAAQPLGFELSWRPPVAPGGLPPELFPPDLDAAPPLLPQYFVVQHWDINESPTLPFFTPLQTGETSDGEVFTLASRLNPQPPQPIVYGRDLLEAYPEGKSAGGRTATFAKLRHVLLGNEELLRLNGNLALARHLLPSRHQYRIWSVDVLGRLSADAAYTNSVQLEKRLLPPPPVGIWDQQGNPFAIEPLRGGGNPDRFQQEFNLQRGVFARVIQDSDDNLAPAEEALLKSVGSPFLTILYWRWGHDERRQDPWVKQFRIYWRQNDPDVVRGNLRGAAEQVGGQIRFSTSLSQAIRSDEFVGSYVTISRIPFFVVRHGGGTTPDFWVEPPAVRRGALPVADAAFELFKTNDSNNKRPTAWDERIASVPLIAAEVYMYIVELGLLLPDVTGGNTPPIYRYQITTSKSSLRGWLGVSAADTELYVSDELSLGGLPGNESNVEAAPVWATFRGRPHFEPPTPLSDVPSHIFRELDADSVPFKIKPLEWMPDLVMDGRVRIERTSGSQLFGLLRWSGSEGNWEVQVKVGEAWVTWSLLPEELAELRSSSLKNLPSKYLWALATRVEFQQDGVWSSVNKAPIAFSEDFTDLLPNQAERYVYRLRLVDETGRYSQKAAYVPHVFRVPEKITPIAPALDATARMDASGFLKLYLQFWLPAMSAASVEQFAFFMIGVPAEMNAQVFKAMKNGAQLLRVPGGSDLRLRLATGEVLEPGWVEKSERPASSVLQNEVPVRLAWQHDLTIQYETRFLIWAVSLSSAGIPSALSAQQEVLAQSAPPLVPGLYVRPLADGSDEVTFGSIAPATMVQVEQRVGGESDFSPVSAWVLPSDDWRMGVVKNVTAPDGERSYRLRVRGKTGQEVWSDPVVVS